MREQTGTALADAKRQAVVDHVLRAARRLVLSTGLDVTMDQLAEASDLSRSTLFRHFISRDALLAAAFDAGMAGYRDGLPVYDGGNLDAWLNRTCHAAHRMNSSIGPGFFELASRPDLGLDLVAVESRRRVEFRTAATGIAETLWTASNASGRIPALLLNAVSVHLSPFFTASATIDSASTWQDAADLAHMAISSALDVALAAR